jgi:hypothetical protein
MVRGERIPVFDVGFGGTDEPCERFLVVLVVLALDDDFLEAVDPLQMRVRTTATPISIETSVEPNQQGSDVPDRDAPPETRP